MTLHYNFPFSHQMVCKQYIVLSHVFLQCRSNFKPTVHVLKVMWLHKQLGFLEGSEYWSIPSVLIVKHFDSFCKNITFINLLQFLMWIIPWILSNQHSLEGWGWFSERCSGYQWLPIAATLWLGNKRNLTFTVHFRDFQRLEGVSSFVTLRWVII